jgi:RNA polymerase sigma factor (sigma-70 family)
LDSEFSDLVDTHAGRLVRLAAFLGSDDAEDVAQEAFCRYYERRHTLSGDALQAGAYLSRTVVNLVRDRHRHGLVRRKVTRLQHRELEQHVPSAEALSLASSDGRRLIAALALLPQRRREAVVLRYWSDLSYVEIASVMGTTVGAAKSAVSRGLTDLQGHLREHLEEDE